MEIPVREIIRISHEMRPYTYKNTVMFYSPEPTGYNFSTWLTLKDIAVTKGKIKFYLEDGRSFCIRDKSLVRNIHPNKKKSSTNKYESYMGNKSVLKHHSNSVVSLNGFTFGLSEKAESYSINGNIAECIHDGVTTFIIMRYEIKDLKFTN